MHITGVGDGWYYYTLTYPGTGVWNILWREKTLESLHGSGVSVRLHDSSQTWHENTSTLLIHCCHLVNITITVCTFLSTNFLSSLYLNSNKEKYYTYHARVTLINNFLLKTDEKRKFVKLCDIFWIVNNLLSRNFT